MPEFTELHNLLHDIVEKLSIHDKEKEELHTKVDTAVEKPDQPTEEKETTNE